VTEYSVSKRLISCSVYAGDDCYNYILNGLHPPVNMHGIAHVDKWLTFPDMGHIVVNYYKRCVVLLTNHEIGNPESYFPLREPPPAKKKSPIMCLGLIPNHFVLIFFEGWLSTTSIIYGVAQSQE